MQIFTADAGPAEMIGNDRRFFGANDSLFNYNANDALVEAIAAGERGAYWSILNRIERRFAQQFEAAERAPKRLPLAPPRALETGGNDVEAREVLS